MAREKINGYMLTTEMRESIPQLSGTSLLSGQVKLLASPAWRNGRWEALARVGNSLCIIEVSLWLAERPTVETE